MTSITEAPVTWGVYHTDGRCHAWHVDPGDGGWLSSCGVPMGDDEAPDGERDDARLCPRCAPEAGQALTPLPGALSEPVQAIARNFVAARARAEDALLEAARLIAEARAVCRHGEWGVFLAATRTSEGAAKRLLDIHAAARQPAFAAAVRSGHLSASVAGVLAQPSTPLEVLETLLAQDVPPTVADVRAAKAEAKSAKLADLPAPPAPTNRTPDVRIAPDAAPTPPTPPHIEALIARAEAHGWRCEWEEPYIFSGPGATRELNAARLAAWVDELDAAAQETPRAMPTDDTADAIAAYGIDPDLDPEEIEEEIAFRQQIVQAQIEQLQRVGWGFVGTRAVNERLGLQSAVTESYAAIVAAINAGALFPLDSPRDLPGWRWDGGGAQGNRPPKEWRLIAPQPSGNTVAFATAWHPVPTLALDEALAHAAQAAPLLESVLGEIAAPAKERTA